MESNLIFNFTENDAVEIVSMLHDAGPIVSIIQRSGSMSFHHAMTPKQAIKMAADLIAHANELSVKTGCAV